MWFVGMGVNTTVVGADSNICGAAPPQKQEHQPTSLRLLSCQCYMYTYSV